MSQGSPVQNPFLGKETILVEFAGKLGIVWCACLSVPYLGKSKSTNHVWETRLKHTKMSRDIYASNELSCVGQTVNDKGIWEKKECGVLKDLGSWDFCWFLALVLWMICWSVGILGGSSRSRK